MPGSPPLQRHVSTKDELLQKALTLPLELRRELATSLLWSMPRNGKYYQYLLLDLIDMTPTANDEQRYSHLTKVLI